MSISTLTATTRPNDDAALAELGSRLAGAVALPGEDGYERSVPWNVAVPVAPRAVVLAQTAQDVADTVRFAAARGLRVAVQATGHGAVALQDDDVVLVHTGRLDEVTVDVAGRTARVGAGVAWQQVLDAATPHGLAPLVGSSTGVGVVGFLTGGGIGPFVRTYGLSSDHVRAFDLITGDGRILRVTPEAHAELFWGLRGGKSSLGIVTAVEIDLIPLSSFHGGALYFAQDDARAVLHAWRELTVDLPEHANTSVAMLQLPPMPGVPEPLAGKFTVAVRWSSVGTAEEGEALLAGIRAVAEPIIDMIGVLPYAAVAAIHADPVDPMPSLEFSALLRELPVEAVDALLEVAGPASGSPQAIVELRLLGGAMARPGRHQSAFSHREAGYNLLTIGVPVPPIAEAIAPHAGQVQDAVAQWATGGVLPNFATHADRDRCYDEDTRHWLAALAEQHDPAGVLRVGQVVRRAIG